VFVGKKVSKKPANIRISTNIEMKPTIMGIVIMENNDGQS